MVLNKDTRRGLHGYSHENPVKMNLEQQHAILDKTYKDLTKFCGKPPRGNVAPWYVCSESMSPLLDRALSMEACLRSVYCVDVFQSSTNSLK